MKQLRTGATPWLHGGACVLLIGFLPYRNFISLTQVQGTPSEVIHLLMLLVPFTCLYAFLPAVT